jgi:hypothetical protein
MMFLSVMQLLLIKNCKQKIIMALRWFLFCSLSFYISLSQAQMNTVFASYAQKQDSLMVNAYKQKDTKAYSKLLDDFLLKYEKLSKEDKAGFNGYYINAFYNLCCTYSLLNDKPKALEYFEKSVHAGYSDYAHTKADTDLDNIRNEEKFKTLVQSLRETSDYLYILKNANQYSSADNKELPKFTYQSSANPDLAALRKTYNLDSIAGLGNETSKVINLLHWVHNTVSHDGQHESGIKSINAYAIINAARTNHVGVSCGELATTLNDCYLAMGWASRKIYCFPKDSLHKDFDSHVINVVFLPSKNKWVWMDPTNDAYVMNENGELLSIEEVRQRLITDKPLIVNPDANWNHKISVTKEDYLDNYMAKNLYRLYCPLNSEYNYETWGGDKHVIYVNLLPVNYFKKEPFKTDDYYNAGAKTTFNTYYIYNSNLFWQSPESE